MEEIKYGDDKFEIPSGLCDDFAYLLDIISPDTWNNILTDEHREMLMKFLPDFPEDDLNEKTHTLEMFFMNENFFFGSPLHNFFLNLKKGFFSPDISKMRKIHRKIMRKSYKFRQKQYYHNLLEEILVKRKELLEGTTDIGSENEKLLQVNSCLQTNPREACIQRAKKRYYKELKAVKAEAGCDSDISDDDSYPEGLGLSLNKKQRRMLFLLEATFPPDLIPVRYTHTRGSLALDIEDSLTPSRNPFDTSDEQFRNLVANHLSYQKRKKVSPLDTRGITLKSILERTETLSKRPVPRPQQSAPQQIPPTPRSPVTTTSSMSYSKKISSSKKRPRSPPVQQQQQPQQQQQQHQQQQQQQQQLITADNIKRELSSDSLSSDGEATQDLDISKNEFSPSPVSSTLEDVKPSLTAELTQETHLSFFSLLRDIFCSTPNQRMSQQQIVSSISTWQDSAISPLNEWFCLSDSWVAILPSAINLLCGKVSSELLPTDFVPFIDYKSNLKYFQWIGAGRDSDSNLESLCQYWISNRDNINAEWPKDIAFGSDSDDSKSSVQSKGTKMWNFKTSQDEDSSEKSEYHEQERTRYGQPHKAFTYKMNGYKSVIGPVKGVYTQQAGNTTKARGHMLLVPDRPPYVTILSLVWDAVARLPNSEGTKLDICELLKESQFLVSINSPGLENTLNSVVSGALDRLQNEKDPCVKFDTSRKLWVYLHKSRSEKELEMMHQLKLRSGSSKAKSGTSVRKPVKKKDEASLSHGPPNVTMEQYSPAIKQMDGSEVRIKDEDILKHWVKLASNNKSKKGLTKVYQAQIKQELNKMKNVTMPVDAPARTPTTAGHSIQEIPQAILPASLTDDAKAIVVSGEVSPQKVCSAIQLSKSTNTLLHTTPSTSTSLSQSSAVKLQASRKYHSSSSSVDKKKSAKSSEGDAPGSSPSTTKTPVTTTTKGGSHVLPTNVTSSSSSAVVSQPKGIKLVQYTNPNIQGKGVVGNTSLVVDSSTGVPAALVGQKLVVAGNRVLVQGGKVLHNVSAANVSGRGRQVLAGVVPAQHIMAINNLKKSSSEQQSGVDAGGRFIQIAALDSANQKQAGYQKLTLVPQFNQATLAASSQKVPENQAKGSITTGELKLKLGSASFATASGNIINLGGKQILLTTKGTPANRGGQIHQLVVPTNSTGQQATIASTSNLGQQVVTTAAAAGVSHQPRLGLGGQQIVVPASALAGSSLNLKRVQAFQSFKVVPASQLSQQQQQQQQHQQQRGKPVVAHILTPTTTAGGKVALQIATSTSNTPEKTNPQ